MVELVHAGRTPTELSREFNVMAQSITNRVGQPAIGSGKSLPGKEGLTAAEREELVRLRRQLSPVQMERDILANSPSAWRSPLAQKHAGPRLNSRRSRDRKSFGGSRLREQTWSRGRASCAPCVVAFRVTPVRKVN